MMKNRTRNGHDDWNGTDIGLLSVYRPWVSVLGSASLGVVVQKLQVLIPPSVVQSSGTPFRLLQQKLPRAGTSRNFREETEHPYSK